ncbi:alpha/beta fold hydrolase [Polyangium aurulentum]|uniref:alpha/beta fold hydrolase n=1 Tax=Polyangium aurulentum TaxID=2567896 RepID=UPI0010AEE3C6|nr:alpha/beta fold hydrolase [Polyangium aurulentum]UQA54588.1 lysophospholipase [Polyangium aurulentum]
MIRIDPGEAVEVALPHGHPQRLRVWRGTGPYVILALHGLDGHAGWFGALGPALARHGVTLLAVDRSGSGVDPRTRGDSAHIDAWLDELTSLCEHLAPPEGLFLLGHSWGAKRVVVALHERMMPVRAGLLVAPLIYLQNDLVPPERWDADPSLGGPEPRFPIRFPDDRLTDDPDVRAFIAADPNRLRHVTASFLIEDARLSRRIEAMRSPLPLPVWIALGGEDQLIDEERTRDLFERFEGGKTVRVEVIDAAAHLVVVERAEALADAIGRFLGTVT